MSTTRLSQSEDVCTFVLDGLYFGVQVETVQEVICYQQMTQVPLAPPAVRGLVNLRGQIVTAIELRRCLDLSERLPGEPVVNVVVCTEEGPVSLLVDEIGDVVTVDSQAFEPLPEMVTGIDRELIRGVYKLSDRLLLLLDTAATVRAAEAAPERV